MITKTSEYPLELFSLMVDAIAVLCKSKKEVVLFLKRLAFRPAKNGST